jgi:hypothetical protein
MRTIGQLSETTTTVDVRDGAIAISVAGEVPLPPERVVDASVDFSQRRERVFPAVSTKRTTVHSLDTTTADVTEGTRAGPFVFWERCTYDWSEPRRVVAVVSDSNVYACPGSLWELAATPTDRGSRVVMTWTRRFQRRPRGRIMGFVYQHNGKRAFTKYARQILSNLAEEADAKPWE